MFDFSEKDSCGVGFVARIQGQADHEVLRLGLEALANHAHRGAVAADGKTGDGAGVMTQLPHTFLQRVYNQIYGKQLPGPGDVAVGVVFLPLQDAYGRSLARRVMEESLRHFGMEPLGWRELPLHLEAIGERALFSRPHIQHLFVDRKGVSNFEGQLYLARRRAERQAREAGIEPFYVASLSSRTMVYKGLCMADQLGVFYPDLKAPDFHTSVCMFHQRYSTNTFPRWELAHPFRLMCHNGEFNTLQGNSNWMRARETALGTAGIDPNVYDLTPVIEPNVSDSGAFDNALEFFVSTGKELLATLLMMIPEMWENIKETDMPAGWRDLYRYFSCLMEPWDGPAAVAFFDGQRVGAMLDRNGLRPLRYTILKGGLVIASSEAGCVHINEADVEKRGMLGPGEIFVVDIQEKVLLNNHQLKERLASHHPYGDWWRERVVPVDPATLEPNPRGLLEAFHSASPDQLRRRQLAFGYNHEDEITVLRPMVTKGQEPVGSMGDDTPPAVLSRLVRPLFHNFRQRFAQVTNPAIDPLRERLVMSLRTLIGRRANVLTEAPEVTRLLELPGPILTPRTFHMIQKLDPRQYPTIILRTVWPVQSGPEALEIHLERLCQEAEEAVRQGAVVVVLYDGDVNALRAPIPSLLATSAVHQRLIKAGLRLNASIIVASGEPREVHHFACLLGYGADAIYPYLAFDTVAEMFEHGGKQMVGLKVEEGYKNFVEAVAKGLFKILARMGISVLSSYRGGQVFEVLGLSDELVNRYFPGTPTALGGVSLRELAATKATWHQQAFALQTDANTKLGSQGFYKYKKDGEAHRFSPQVIKALQRFVNEMAPSLVSRPDPWNAEVPASYLEFARVVRSEGSSNLSPRDLLDFVRHRAPIALDRVEPVEGILARFSTGAMSHGSLSSEAHETLAVALNRLGASSNSGEGGEAPERFGTLKNSAIKQVASGRFGVTPAYLMSARELQIKIAQGAKPGEGGQIPGNKVTEEIARIRHTSPGIALISPPPHHDIYSIEDLSQLIYDLRRIHPEAAISVKLVAEEGVGTVAAGVAKGFADLIHISGCEGGTGASPLSSIKFAGMPWEVGLAQAQQALVMNQLRGHVRLRVDGGFLTGRDVVVAAILGADEYSFGTGALVAEGCLMARSCHTNGCPVGIASQDPRLRALFPGTPEGVMAFLLGVASEVRTVLASLGITHLNKLIGRTELLEQVVRGPAAGHLELGPLLFRPRDDQPRYHKGGRNLAPVRGRDLDQEVIDGHRNHDTHTQTMQHRHELDTETPLQTMQHRHELDTENPLGTLEIRNTDRTFGARVSNHLVKHGGSLKLKLRGTAGQSFGAFCVPGLELHLEGEANDYVGKGMNGGEICIAPLAAQGNLIGPDNWILGNTALYGATGGKLLAAGRSGMRFAVRNSGAQAVVEGVGEHACQYMTSGTVVVLGRIGRNFGAAMTGGAAYLYDFDRDVLSKVNPELVDALPVTRPEHAQELRALIEEHKLKTGSKHAAQLLADWTESLKRFFRVAPRATAAKIEGQNEGHEATAPLVVAP